MELSVSSEIPSSAALDRLVSFERPGFKLMAWRPKQRDVSHPLNTFGKHLLTPLLDFRT
jgi:hypothetical protein